MAVEEPIVVVSGPTAGGKSELAVKLALDLNGEILSIDSVQVYRGLDIGTAKLNLTDRRGVPHHLLDICSPDEPYNAARFLEDANLALAEISQRRKRCIAVGGSSMYLKVLLHGLAALPPADHKIRERLSKAAAPVLHRYLRRLNPRAASLIHPNDHLRLARAIEAAAQTGNSFDSLIRSHGFNSALRPALIVVPLWERDVLFTRIAHRATLMVSAGLLEETRALTARFGREVPALKTIGYQQAFDCLSGICSEQDLPEQIAKATRRFARRQMTFWRNEPTKRGWKIAPLQDGSGVLIGTEEGIPSGPQQRKGIECRTISYSELLEELRDPSDRSHEIQVLFVRGRGIFETEH